MSEETLGLPLRTLETVGTDTPARAATIRIEGLCVRDMIALPCEIYAKSLDKTFYCRLTLAVAPVNRRLWCIRWMVRAAHNRVAGPAKNGRICHEQARSTRAGLGSGLESR